MLPDREAPARSGVAGAPPTAQGLSRQMERPAAVGPPEIFHVFPSFGHGGVPIRISAILNHLRAPYRHVVAALDGNLDCRSRLDPGLDVSLRHPEFAAGRPLSRLRKIARCLAAARPDLLVTYNWGSIEWALVNRLFARLPHIHMDSGFGVVEATRLRPRRVMMRRVALARTRRIVVPSHTLMRIAEHGWHIDPAVLTHIPNGVDCDRFDTAADPGLIAGFEKRPGELIVGTVAPLRPEKNLTRLIDAFAALADRFPVRLLIVGDGSERRLLEARAATHDIAGRVIFAGHVDAPEKVLGLIDVFAMSSDTEQMPNALIQAMAAGRPVAAVGVGDISRILPPANRPFVAPPADTEGLAAAIAALLADAALRDRVAAANRVHVRTHYSLPVMLRAYESLFDAHASRSGEPERQS